MLQKRELTGVAKTFWDTAQYLRGHEWCQGRLRVGNAVCSSGAFYEVTRIDNVREMAFNEEAWAFGVAFQRLVGKPLGWWNDVPGRTKEQVIAKLEEIAWKLQDEQGG